MARQAGIGGKWDIKKGKKKGISTSSTNPNQDELTSPVSLDIISVDSHASAELHYFPIIPPIVASIQK